MIDAQGNGAGDPRDLAAARASERIGAVVHGGYRLVRLIGLGGMAAVYEGRRPDGARAAVKLLHPEIALDAQARERFLREGYAANRVGHPGAVRVLDVAVDDGGGVLVMELLEGETADQRARRRGGALGLHDLLGVAEQALATLAAAHAQGIVHRDLKPENLFLTRDGRVKLLDFGIAGLAELARMPADLRATRTGNAMGTPAFMPPEQALGEWDRVDGRSDLWALAATLVTLASGRLVHEAESLQKQMLAAMTKPVEPVATLAPSLPVPIARVLDQALAFRREDRFADAGDFAAALLKAARRAEPAGVRSAPSTRSLVAFAASAGAAAIAIAAAVMLHASEASRPVVGIAPVQGGVSASDPPASALPEPPAASASVAASASAPLPPEAAPSPPPKSSPRPGARPRATPPQRKSVDPLGQW